MNIDLTALTTYTSAGCVVDTIAEAWLLLSDPDDPKGNVDVSSLEQAYISEDWAKLAGRILAGFAEAYPRPATWPWRDPRFDGFRWMA